MGVDQMQERKEDLVSEKLKSDLKDQRLNTYSGDFMDFLETSDPPLYAQVMQSFNMVPGENGFILQETSVDSTAKTEIIDFLDKQEQKKMLHALNMLSPGDGITFEVSVNSSTGERGIVLRSSVPPILIAKFDSTGKGWGLDTTGANYDSYLDAATDAVVILKMTKGLKDKKFETPDARNLDNPFVLYGKSLVWKGDARDEQVWEGVELKAKSPEQVRDYSNRLYRLMVSPVGGASRPASTEAAPKQAEGPTQAAAELDARSFIEGNGLMDLNTLTAQASSLLGKPVGSRLRLISDPSKSGTRYDVNAQVLDNGQVQVIFSGDPAASPQQKGQWERYKLAAQEIMFKDYNDISYRNLTQTTRQQMGGTSVLVFGNKTAEGGQREFMSNNSLPSNAALQRKVDEFLVSAKEGDYYTFQTFHNYLVSVIKKDGRALVHLAGSEDADAAGSKADWDQYRTNTKALFSPYPGYTVEDASELALPNGVTSIYVKGKPREAVAQASAPRSTPTPSVSASPDAPKAAPEKPVYTAADIKDEGDFINKRLHENGWKNYVVDPENIGNVKAGEIVAKLPTDINDPDYKFSRIHHFLGKDESVQEIKDFSNLDVTVNGEPVEWRATTEYPSGTWVNPETGKRFPVINGTRIEWKQKAPALVAEAASSTPDASAEVADEKKAETVAFLPERELHDKAIQLKNDREVVATLTAQRDALVAKKGKLFSNDRKLTEEIAKLDADIRTVPDHEGKYGKYVESVRTLTAAISEQVNNPAYASVLYDVFSQEIKDKDSRLALNLPTPVEPAPSPEGSPAEVVTEVVPTDVGDGKAVTDGNNGEATPSDQVQMAGDNAVADNAA